MNISSGRSGLDPRFLSYDSGIGNEREKASARCKKMRQLAADYRQKASGIIHGHIEIKD
jgi:hypothetical protein